ncbi:hypothetical protein GCM10007276_01780 [Agaricicola taiwanensis]|uniref:TIGR02444 family protein n=1 Tax=Agaricicola taiwanensis TaxID=591372 RepID=A0A8J2YF33_9RHOB|nr:TIGR02444 family protein [Agaricicola taiwanensis]GGE28224.1 hypothetical protein GCM10007276_01780 [Agaricicola taiwanensis]
MSGGDVQVNREGPHWAFSLAVYGGAGVSDACLHLQDTCGVDVNVMLLCAYRRAQGLAVDEALLAMVETTVDPWREGAILPLRQLRRDLKKGVASVPPETLSFARKKISDAEITAEMVEQELIMRAMEGGDRRPSDEPLAQVVMKVVKFYAGRRGLDARTRRVTEAVEALAGQADRCRHLVPPAM